jgi:hypothetical protein
MMDVKFDILYRYPYPLAMTYHNADNAREVLGAHDQRIKLFEVILKYLASIVIAQYVHDGAEDEQVNNTLRGLARPSLGQWNGFLRQILSYYDRLGKADRLFIPEMYPTYFEKSKDRPVLAEAYNAMRNFLEERTDSSTTSLSIRQFFDIMITYRNKTVGHGSLTRYHCEQINDVLLNGLVELLTALPFLKDHRLVYIEDVRVRRGSYTHEMISFMGSTPPSRMKSAYIAENPDEYRVEEQLYLCGRDNDIPMLSLHPLMIAWQGDVLFLNESEREKDIEYLSYQTGQIKKPDRLVEDFKEILGAIFSEEQIVPPVSVAQSPFEQGVAAMEAESWAQAVALLSQVPEDAEEYATAQARLVEAQQQRDLENKYRSLRQLMDEGQWEQALDLIKDIRAVDADYHDVRALTTAVRTQQARERSLETLYGQVQEALAAKKWERALDLLRRLRELNADYRDVAVLLNHHEHLASLHDQAVQAMAQRKWAVAITVLNQVKALEPDYKNVDELLAKTQAGLDAEADLAELYDRAKEAMALDNWSESLELLEQLEKQDAEFRDVQQLLGTVRSRLTIPCWRCGSPVSPERKFCGKCGAPREKPAQLIWTCWQCGAQVPSRRKFCGKCGAPREKPQTVTCPQCGRENSADRKFCTVCGTELGPVVA